MKKIYKLILILLVIIMTGCANKKEEKLKIVTVNFPAYDFAISWNILFWKLVMILYYN